MGRAYPSISIGVDIMTGCLPNRAIEFPLPIVPTAFYPFARPPSNPTNEFEVYCNQACTAVDPSMPINLVQWWWNNQGSFLTLFQDAHDKLAIPAMSDECERVFSSAGKMITLKRNHRGFRRPESLVGQ